MNDEMGKMAQELGLGATGEFPHGKVCSEDQGELRAALTCAEGRIIIHFGKPVVWLWMMPEQARDFAALLLKHADRASGEQP